MNWNEIDKETYYHSLHFNSGVAEKFDNLCKESVDFIFDRFSDEEKINILKSYLFEDMRERSSPKDIFVFLENNYGKSGKKLIQKYKLSPKNFI